MNKTHRLIWNALSETWVAVAEHVRGRGKRGSKAAVRAAAALAASMLVPAQAHAQAAPPAPNALPAGGQVVAGQARITANPGNATLTVTQSSQRAAVDWNSFDVGSQARVDFVQPGASAVTLNRVQGGNASQIFGRITANGQVFLSNPNGVYFAPGASVDVGGLVATTHRIGLDDFMAGRVKFERNGAAGSVINHGELKAALGGYIALLAPEVRNQGVILASLGTVALAAGETFELRFDGSNTLAGLRVTPSAIKALVDNRSAVLAPGGLIVLSAQALDRVQGGVIQNSGRIEATGLAQRGGRIVLDASDRIDNAGRASASATEQGPAGSVVLKAPEVVNSGAIEAKGSAEHDRGGHVGITAGNVTQTATGVIDASAPAVGGTVEIHASGTVDLAGRVTAAATAATAADADRQMARITKPVVPIRSDTAQPGTVVPKTDGAAAPANAAKTGVVADDADAAYAVDTARTGKPIIAADTPAAEAPHGGRIAIQAAQITLRNATLDVSGASGGQVRLDASAPTPSAPPAPAPAPAPGRLALLGGTEITSRGRRGSGGALTLLGRHIELNDTTRLDARGASGGGQVLVGGGWQGGGDLPQAASVTMGRGAQIDVSATDRGDGGTAVLWSDVRAEEGSTRARGSMLARGGAAGGNGGRIETSGHVLDVDGLRVDAGAIAGIGGLWLLDPYNYTINAAAAASIGGTLNSGTSVTVTTTNSVPAHGASSNSGDAGDISVDSLIAKTAGGDATLTLRAHRRVSVNQGITSSQGKLNVVLWADQDGTQDGGVAINDVAVNTNGGHLWAGGSTNGGSATWNGLTVGNGPSIGASGANFNAFDLSAGITTGGGDVLLWAGNGMPDGGTPRGLGVKNNPVINAGSGNVSLLTNRLYNWDAVNSSLTINSTGTLTVAPGTNSGWSGGFNWSGTAAGGNFTLNGALGQPLVINGIGNLSGLNIGSHTGISGIAIGNTANVTIGSAIGVAGAIGIHGGQININANLTSTATGDIFIKSTSSANPSIHINADILKTGGGTSTLTLQAQGRVTLQIGRKIQASGAGTALNTVFWSDYDNSNNDGGVSIMGDVTTNGGHLWAGGSNSNGGSAQWNGLTVGDGPSIGSDGYNHNAMDFRGNVSTGGGNVLLWAGTGFNGATNGINTDTAVRNINSGSGNITLIADAIFGSGTYGLNITSTGHFTYQPDSSAWQSSGAGGIGGQLEANGSVSSGNFIGSGDIGWLRINNVSSLTGLTFGKDGNTSSILTEASWTINGPISLIGNDISISLPGNLTTTAPGAGILLKARGNITSGANRTFQTNNGNITLWSDADGNGSGFIGFNSGVVLNSANGETTQSTGGGAITLAGGSTSSNGLPTGYASAASGTSAWGDNAPSGVQLGAYGYASGSGWANDIRLYSGGGNVLIQGRAADNSPGVSWYAGNGGTQLIDAGAGTITVNGQGVGTGHGIELSYFGGGATSSPTLRSGSSAAGAITINGSTTSSSIGHVGYQGTATLIATGSGGISLTGTGNSGQSINANVLNAYAASGPIDFTGIFGSGMRIGGNWGKGTLTASSDVTLTANNVSLAAGTLDTTGSLTVKPYGISFSNTFTWLPSNLTVSGTLGGLTLGKSGNTSDIIFGSATSIAGPVSVYGGNISINAGLTATGGNTITLQGSAGGAVTDGPGGYVDAANLRLLGGNVSLDSSSNAIGTLAANGVGTLTYFNGTALTLGTVGGTNGVTAGGTISIATRTGDLTVAGNVATTDASSTALTLNAGRNAAAGDASGGNLVVSGSPTVSVGAGGIARLYTGSIAGSTGLTALVGSGSGRFRYNSDESSTGYTLALSGGSNAIYREQPTVTHTIADATIVYGNAYTAELGFGNAQNGDTYTQAFAGTPTITVGGSTSTSGHYTVGTHALTGSGGAATSQLGYAVTGGLGSGTLTVTPRALTVGYTASDKIYDGSTTAAVSRSGDDRVAGDVLTVGWSSATFASRNVGAGHTVSVAGVGLSGADAANYTVADGSTTASITPRTVTLAAGKVYDGTTALGAGTVTIGNLVAGETLGYGGAVASDAHVATGGKYVSAITLADGGNGGLAGNYQLPVLNAANAPVTITPRPLAASAAIGGTLSKVYDGTTAATGVSLTGSVSGGIAGDTITLNTGGVSLAYDSAHVASATSIVATGSAGFTIGSSSNGSQAGDYSLSAPTIAAVSAGITPRPLSATLTNGSATKVYDGSAAAPAGFTPGWSVSGLVAGDSVSVGHTAATYDSPNVANASKVTVSGLAIAGVAGPHGSQAGDYALTTTQTEVAATITPRILTVSGLTAAGKTYDGTAAATITHWGHVDTGIAGESLNLSASGAQFADPNAGTGKLVTASGYTLANGTGLASNYQLASTTATTTADIAKAVLTVTANNDAKFVTQGDAAGYNGVSYGGFVHGENAASAGIGGSATIVRSNAGTETAGHHAGVLVPDVSGLTATNYSFQASSGDYTIVPAGQLLVRVTNANTTYGSAANYTISGAQYLDSGANVIVTLSTITPLGNNRYSVSDGAGGSASFTLTPGNAPLSGAGLTAVGTHAIGATDVSVQNGQNFSNMLTVVGNHVVGAKGVAASVVNGLTKVYDGTTAMNGVSLDLAGVESGDGLTVSGRGAFASRNAGTNVGYTISDLSLSGNDASNYYLTGGASFTGSNGRITPRPLTIGYGGVDKVYDGQTAATVTTHDNRIAGDLLTVNAAAVFSDRNVGSGKPVTITGVSLSGADAGNYTVAATGSTTASITRLDSVTWVGGSSGNWFDPANWAGGAIPDLANVANVTIPAGVTVSFDTAGAVGGAQTGPVVIDRLGNAGSMVQRSGELNVGSGGLSLSGFEQRGGALASAGPVTLDSLTQTGGRFATADSLTVNRQFSQSGSGSLTVGGSAAIANVAGTTMLGNLQVGGALTVASPGGNVEQAGGTSLAVAGTTTVDAGTHDVTLNGAGNDFGGPFNARGRDITVADGHGGLTLGDVTASGRLDAISTGGDLTQAEGSKLAVAGDAALRAPAGQVRLATGGNTVGGTLTTQSGGMPAGIGSDLPTILPPVAPSFALPHPDSAPAPLEMNWAATVGTSDDGTSGNDAAAESGRGVTVRLIDAPNGSTSRSVQVIVTADLAARSASGAGTVGPGFSFALPPALTRDAPADARITVAREDGKRLPRWLRFDAQRRLFVVSAIPPRGLPLRMIVTIGGERTSVELMREGRGAMKVGRR